jgi:radical SAM superfamily enzyme YgiQ (UPF0313 family)/ubiquinone/menaquinone biosynthesis C-methylase UbiE
MNKYDVLLIKPPLVRFGFNISGVFSLPHLGLGYLGAVLKAKGFSVGYIDAQIPEENPELNPGVLGDAGLYALTAKVTNIAPTQRVAQIIRNRNPDAKIILGGPCDVFSAESIFDQFPIFDVLGRGEGENMIAPVARALLAGGKFEDLRDLPGLAVKTKSGVVNTKAVEPADLSEEIYPLRSLWRQKPYKLDRIHPPYGVYPPAALVETARGCTYNCNFCLISRCHRFRPIEYVVSEIEDLIRVEGIREVHFVDPTFTLNSHRTEMLCDALKNLSRPVKWSCKTRTDHVTPDMLKLMAESGCYMIAYGLESGSDNVLGSMNKQADRDQSFEALEWTQNAGIRSLGYILVGSPGETDQSIAETNRRLRASKAWFVLFGINMPIPTEISKGSDSLKNEIALLRYYSFGDLGPFRDKNYYQLENRKLNEWMIKSMLGFYFHPLSMWRIVRGISSPGEVFHYMGGAVLMGREVVKYAFRKTLLGSSENVRFSDGVSQKPKRQFIRNTRVGIIPKIRLLEVWFFRSSFGLIFGYVQKYLARELYSTESAKIVDESWEGTSILDVGCGHGTFLLEVGKLAKDVIMTGIDQSPSLISFAKKSARIEGCDRIRFEVMDAHDLKVEDQQFDIATSTSSIYLWHDPVKALNEINRVLKPGGRAYICDQIRAGSPGNVYKSWIKQKIFGFGISAYTNEELISFFEQSDFESYRFWHSDTIIWFEAKKAT